MIRSEICDTTCFKVPNNNWTFWKLNGRWLIGFVKTERPIFNKLLVVNRILWENSAAIKEQRLGWILILDFQSEL